MKRKIELIILTITMMMLIVACSDSTENKTIKKNDSKDENLAWMIGGIGSIREEDAEGLYIKNGIKLAVDEINDNGGINGYKISYFFQDDENQVKKTSNTYNMLMDWGLQILIGPTNKECAVELYSKTEDDSIFVFCPSNESNGLITKYTNVFEIQLSDSEKGKEIANIISNNYSGQNIGILTSCETNEFYLLNNAFKKNIEDKEINLVLEKNYKPNKKTDYEKIISEFKEKNVNLILLEVEDNEVEKIYQAMEKLEYDVSVAGFENMESMYLSNSKLNVGEFIEIYEYEINSNSSINKKFKESYIEKYNQEPRKSSAEAYDAIYAIKKVIEDRDLSPEMTQEDLLNELIDGMKKINFSGLAGSNIHWKEDGTIEKKLQTLKINND